MVLDLLTLTVTVTVIASFAGQGGAASVSWECATNALQQATCAAVCVPEPHKPASDYCAGPGWQSVGAALATVVQSRLYR